MKDDWMLKSHGGALARKWCYAVGIVAVGAGMAVATQYLWAIPWYITFAVIGGVVLLGMVANTLQTVHTQVRPNREGDGLLISGGVLVQDVRNIRYDRILSYSIKPSRLDEKMGCRQLIITVAQGTREQQDVELCLSIENAQLLLDYLQEHLHK